MKTLHFVLILLLFSPFASAQRNDLVPASVFSSGNPDMQTISSNKQSKKLLKRVSSFEFDTATKDFKNDTLSWLKVTWSSTGEPEQVFFKESGLQGYLKNIRPCTNF